ncbi:hypothetical protein Tco_0764322, partial [Tanacetum coccineum]
ADMDHEKPGFELGELKMESNGIASIMGYRKNMFGVIEIRGCEPPFIVVRVLEAKNKEVRCHVSIIVELEKLGDDVGDLRSVDTYATYLVIKATDDKDCSLMFGVFKLMKCVSEDSGDELEYLRELFLDTDLHNVLSLHMHYKLRILIIGPTLDNARSYVMQGAPFTQEMISSIPIGGSISPEGFLPSILLLVVIIVTVVIAIVILIVVVIDDVSLFLKLSFDRASLVKVPVANATLFSPAQLLRENTDSFRVPVCLVFLLGLLALAIVAACASRAVAMPLAISCWMAAKVMAGVLDVDVLFRGILST